MQDYNELEEIEGIAIIGMSGRFPGANSIEEFWLNLANGVESIKHFSKEELSAEGVPSYQLALPNYIRAAPVLDDIDKFDAAFFNITPGEAALMDPQHRLFLETSWEAMEHAGYDPFSYEGLTGVYAGMSASSYAINNIWPDRNKWLATVGALTLVTTNDRDYLPTRVSYRLNLHGPSFNVQSACSTSLVATHLACQSLMEYQCDLALAGGVRVTIPHVSGYLYTQGGINSPDGHCRPFDEKAQGTVFSNASAAIVLKRLSEAIEDGDNILAVIRGSAINNDGSDKVGFTAPSMDGQMKVLMMAQAAADVHPEEVSYIETHGTGTMMGDPLEMEALTQAFRARTDKKQYCAIGSLKGNIGHTDAVAGVSGLIKTALALHNKQIPPSINFDTPNPKIDFENSPFFVNTKLREWQRNGTPRRAGVSSFGIGGTNAHAVLEEAPETSHSGDGRRYQLVTMAARTPEALEQMTDNLAAHLQANPDQSFADTAFTLHVGRADFEYRRTLIAANGAEAAASLAERHPKQLLNGAPMQQERQVIFMFSGQGSQFVNMGRDLYEQEPAFRATVDGCCAILEPLLDLDLRTILFPPTGEEEAATAQLTETWLTQPALFTIEYALAKLLMSWGIEPVGMIGHSIGEYIAACLAGVFSFEDALNIVAVRGRLMQSMPHGSMTAVPLAEADVLPYLGDDLSIGAINSLTRCVVSGPTEAIEAFEATLANLGHECRRLHTSHAFHSPMMAPILEPFTEKLRQMTLNEPTIPYVSNVTGTWITPEEATDPSYYAQHLRQAVRFAAGVGELAKTPTHVLLEVGPGASLRTLAQRHPERSVEQMVLTTMRHPRDVDQHDDAVLLKAVGQLWLGGVRPNWDSFYADQTRHRIPLPTYPFERESYWIEPDEDDAARKMRAATKNPELSEWFYLPSWKRSLPPILETSEPQNWLLFTTDEPISAAVQQQVADLGHHVTTVHEGDFFEVVAENAYTIDPSQPDDYAGLWTALVDSERLPHNIIHLWNMPSFDGLETDTALNQSFYSLLYLSQAIGATVLTEPLNIAVFSTNMQQVATDGVTVEPEKATVIGPCKVASVELANVTCRSIDVETPHPQNLAAVAAQIVAEASHTTDEIIAAYRGGNRYVQTFEDVALPATPSFENGMLRDGGVYLITGGMGGIGLTLARYLAQQVQAKLVLTSRSKFPAQDQWGEWLATHNAQDRTSQRIESLRELIGLGAEVLVVAADIANADQMRAAVEETVAAFGPISGVIHTAGLPGGGIIQLKTTEMADRVLIPKVHGTRNLETALHDQTPDFLLLCSSVTGVTGGFGQVDYCAANAFMDAYATAKNGVNGTHVVSVNWDAWSEVGMAVNTATNFTSGGSGRPDGEPFEHQILDQKRQEDEQLVFDMTFEADKHWVLTDHQVVGIPTAPGTTHLELLRAAYSDTASTEQMLVPEVIFMTPLMVARGETRDAKLHLKPRNDSYDFEVMSAAGVKANGEVQWEMHMMGQVEPLDVAEVPAYNLPELIAACDTDEIEVGAYQGRRMADGSEGVTFGPRWQVLKHVYVGDGQAVARLRVADEFAHDVAEMGLHPALLDIATSFSIGVDADTLYLPLTYKNLRLFGPLTQEVYAYTRRLTPKGADNETLSFHVTLLAEDGTALVDVESFTLKRVTDQAAQRMREAPSSEEDSAETNSDPSYQRALTLAMTPSEGAEAFERILIRNRMPQIVVCTRHLPTLIEQIAAFNPESMMQQAGGGSGEKHARPNLTTTFVAPRNETEQVIASVWQEILGIDQIGIYDNFFDLGGESIVGIQIINQLRQKGVNVSPDQLFQNQTVSELAAVVDPTAASANSVFGLTSVQQGIIASDAHKPHLLIYTLKDAINPQLFEQALGQLWNQHKALQFEFSDGENGWEQSATAIPSSSAVTTVDLTQLSQRERKGAISAEIQRLNYGFRQPEQPLVRGGYLDLGGDDDVFVLAVSPLIADSASLTTLADNLWQAVGQLAAGDGVELVAPSGNFADWLRAADAYEQWEPLFEQWNQTAQKTITPLPRDPRINGTVRGGRQAVEVVLSAEKTQTLHSSAEQVNVTATDLLLTALSLTVNEWHGATDALINFAAEQRPSPFIDVDTTTAVGALSLPTPLLIIVSDDDLSNAINTVKELVRGSALSGLAYEKWVGQDETTPIHPEISFAWQPAIQPTEAATALDVQWATAQSGHALTANDGVELTLTWSFDKATFTDMTVEPLLQRLTVWLDALVDHCQQKEDVSFTPSDFPEAGLSQDDLSAFIAKISKE